MPDPGPQPGDLTPWSARSTGGERFRRGLRSRCPRCGGDDITDGFFDLKDACPDCSWTFEREEGYWVGAMVMLMAMVLGSFAMFLAIGILAFWPDVRWTALLWSGLALNLAVPIVFYRRSKSAWLGLHVAFVPAELDQDHAGRTGV